VRRRTLNEALQVIRGQMTPGDEGSLWTLFYDDPDGTPVIAQAIDGGADQLDSEWLRNFASVLGLVDATAYLFAIIRNGGWPHPSDQQLWRNLRVLLQDSRCQILGFLVVGENTHWCAPDDDAPAAA
jgi:hypothetical protein